MVRVTLAAAVLALVCAPAMGAVVFEEHNWAGTNLFSANYGGSDPFAQTVTKFGEFFVNGSTQVALNATGGAVDNGPSISYSTWGDVNAEVGLSPAVMGGNGGGGTANFYYKATTAQAAGFKVIGLKAGEIWLWWGGGQKDAGTVLGSADIAVNSTWTQVSVPFTVNSPDYWGVVFAWNMDGSGLSLDEVTITPEPATMGLLGLGGLALLRRRRR